MSKAYGFYHNIAFSSKLNCIVCNGLGGTSLINGNIYLEADRSTLSASGWPLEIASDAECLEKCYTRSRNTFRPERYPIEDFPELSKTELFQEEAENIGLRDRYRVAAQTTKFSTGINSSGLEYSASLLNSQDFTGNNDGSKQTVLSTYIADAWNWGAEIFTQCEVRRIQEMSPLGEGYIVFFAWHGQNRSSVDMYRDPLWVHAKKAVFIGAGVFGTTEILLRSQENGLALSSRVGQRVSDNGEAWGLGGKLTRGDSHIRPVDKILPVQLVLALLTIEIWIVSLKDGDLAVQNPAREDRDYLEHVKLLTRAAKSVGGTMLIPGSQCGRPRFIFHPTGGVCMASDGTGSTGAANHAGELFKGHGSETHEGLVVVDGAIIPAALGISPMATISALAERSVHLYTMRHPFWV
ncbi:hypothetical protein FJTKL_10646 [Diaporthe vaccinii]|uniref:Glucose-methanol-choline oxidoreductase N-terminal domain-containing protein n=1 Tax=Diaporthe vaccinii TaxID=105482 RepID=A0ABR4FB76_9PEZI